MRFVICFLQCLIVPSEFNWCNSELTVLVCLHWSGNKKTKPSSYACSLVSGRLKGK